MTCCNFSVPVSCLAVVAILGLSTIHLYRKIEKEPVSVTTATTESDGRTEEYPFPILEYPLEIDNASEFLDLIMLGQPSPYDEINPEFKNMQFFSYSRSTCQEDLDILILVKSVVFNKADRDFHRSTWANLPYLSKFSENIQVVFLVGVPEETPDQILLQDEMNIHHDIVQGDFIDNNFDTTVKVLGGLTWAHNFCKNFKFLAFINSDVYFSLENTIKFLRDPQFYPAKRKRSILKTNKNPLSLDKLSQTDFFAGGVTPFNLGIPGRTDDDGGPILVTNEEYSPQVFPIYVRSPFQILSQQVASKFYHLAPFVQYLYPEEIYLGLLANKLRIQPVNTDYIKDQLFVTIGENKTLWKSFKNLICLHNLLLEERHMLWSYFNPVH
ncbi:unnamed protein product [Allacma fusca]|uniref:Hexosyltransferase n=1 Tax=Allacma fusca TaxID=39272 RepID=A0A8J2LDQ9_9HEXA|nr:unnamed protein product [Allacma fusca]